MQRLTITHRLCLPAGMALYQQLSACIIVAACLSACQSTRVPGKRAEVDWDSINYAALACGEKGCAKKPDDDINNIGRRGGKGGK